jgi:hypothetical protein
MVATVEQKRENAIMEKTELRCDIRALNENELDLVTGGLDYAAAARALAAYGAIAMTGGHPAGWTMAAYILK